MSLSKITGHTRFIKLVMDNLENDEVPDMTAWPFSRDDFIAAREEIRSVVAPAPVPTVSIEDLMGPPIGTKQ